MSAQSDNLESALWEVLRILEERQELAGRMERRARETGRQAAARHYNRQVVSARQSAPVIRGAINETLGRDRIARPEVEAQRVATG